jgi:hypothetical protein
MFHYFELLSLIANWSNLGKTTVGYRYWKGNDTGAIVLFDKQGTIAGIQIAVSMILSLSV